MVESVCSKRETIRVAGNDFPQAVVKSWLLKLNAEHIRFVNVAVEIPVGEWTVWVDRYDWTPYCACRHFLFPPHRIGPVFFH